MAVGIFLAFLVLPFRESLGTEKEVFISDVVRIVSRSATTYEIFYRPSADIKIVTVNAAHENAVSIKVSESFHSASLTYDDSRNLIKVEFSVPSVRFIEVGSATPL